VPVPSLAEGQTAVEALGVAGLEAPHSDWVPVWAFRDAEVGL
jgi:hypothetical protein